MFATVVLLAKMPLIGYAARRTSETTSTSTDLHTAGIQLAVHAAGDLLVLLRNHSIVGIQAVGSDPLRTT